jgi:hypothetical protein
MLALSDDGQYLYVALTGAGAVRRVELATQTAGLQFFLGNSPIYGPVNAEDIEVMPGDASVVAITRSGGVAIYDNGVKRPVEITIMPFSSLLAFSDSAGMLFGSYGNSFQTMAVSSNGVTQINSTAMPLESIPAGLKFGDGRIYAATGAVVDPTSRMLAGFLTNPSYTIPVNSFVVDSAMHRVFVLGSDGPAGVIRAYNSVDFTLIGSINLSGFAGNPIGKLVRWGDDGLAFIVRTSLVCPE